MLFEITQIQKNCLLFVNCEITSGVHMHVKYVDRFGYLISCITIAGVYPKILWSVGQHVLSSFETL